MLKTLYFGEMVCKKTTLTQQEIEDKMQHRLYPLRSPKLHRKLAGKGGKGGVRMICMHASGKATQTATKAAKGAKATHKAARK